MNMKKASGLVVITLALGLIIGFFGGMQYKAYQIRSAFRDVFSGTPTISEKSETVMEQAKKEEKQIIEKNIGDEITLSTIKFKITGVEEAQTVNKGYGAPNVAKEGAKFVIIKVSLTNITTSEFMFSLEGIMLVDNQKREFSHYNESMNNNIDLRDLPPSITENGIAVYEVAADATSYGLVVGKSGTNELYRVLLK